MELNLDNLEKAQALIQSMRSDLDNLERTVESKMQENKDTGLFDCLAVTQVQVYPFKEGPSLGHIKGLAQVVLNDQMVIRGLRVMDDEHCLYVSYPKDVSSVCFPITRQLREHIKNCVLEKYQQVIGAKKEEK